MNGGPIGFSPWLPGCSAARYVGADQTSVMGKMSASDERRKMVEPLDLVADLVEAGRVADIRLQTLERELKNRDFDIRALEARTNHLLAQLTQNEELAVALEQRALHAEQVAEDLHNRILSIYRSTSWRLGGPMRRIMRMIRRGLGRAA